MDDKCIMEDLLLTEKTLCDMYMHGTIEAATPNVKQAFNKALNDSLCMEGDIYKKMSEKGWYPTQQAQEQQIQQIKQKYSNVSSSNTGSSGSTS